MYAGPPSKTPVERLQELTTGPFPPEPPRKSLVVSGLMSLVERSGFARSDTPQSSYASGDAAKVAYEYEGEAAESFWAIVAPYATAALLTDADLLDVGCGWGGKSIYYAAEYPLRSVTGMDLPGFFEPEVPLQFARERGVSNVTFVSGYAERIPLPSEAFDVAVMEDVLEHVREPSSVLAEVWRVLRPGGRLVARFPSIRMLAAHHFDRAVKLPGLHYLLPWRTWAAGFNHHLLYGGTARTYVPFERVVPTRFHKGVSMGLNGMDLRAFRSIAAGSPFRVEALALVPYPEWKFGSRRGLLRLYRTVQALGPLREVTSRSIVFVGEKHA